MKPDFEIGDTVETIDDNIKGVVISIENQLVKILSEDDFELTFQAHELIKITEKGLSIKTDDLKKVLQQELHTNRKIPIKKEKHTNKIEIDLHIHELIDDARHLSNFEILNIQLNKAKQQLEWAMDKRIKYVVFIHGVGQGVLKAELQTLFRRYENLEFYDADYQTYGVGATEVCIY
ncbi:Smr/MutS family protein [Flavobacterium sp. CS20]|jgi:dsDNA-specific endonuclease/ATPase MutS2|uniref:Smr/MutS family protein n=1 Tax=Flavobacterium sp. CS20 TaxID=2775246 RepID=UPI001FFD33C9|nr:Smr/MutS family protein [Flavobacterium sp. CS20]